MPELLVTNDYSIFKKHEGNRSIDEGNLKKIVTSLQTHNLLNLRPILVDPDMRVLDGQHRLEAAKKLNVPIYYQIDNTNEPGNILLLNVNQKKWDSQDYLNYYVSKGNRHFINIKKFCDENGLTIGQYLRLCSSNTKHPWTSFKAGTLIHVNSDEENQNKHLKQMQEIISIIKTYVLKDPPFLKASRFKNSLISFIRQPKLDFEIFKSKIIQNAHALKPCISLEAYTSMLKDIYNWKNQAPLE